MPRSQSKCNTPLTLIPFHDVSTLQCIYTTDTAAAWLKLYVICVYIQLPSLLLLSYHCPPLKHSPILRLINNLKTIIIYHRFLLFFSRSSQHNPITNYNHCGLFIFYLKEKLLEIHLHNLIDCLRHSHVN